MFWAAEAFLIQLTLSNLASTQAERALVLHMLSGHLFAFSWEKFLLQILWQWVSSFLFFIFVLGKFCSLVHFFCNNQENYLLAGHSLWHTCWAIRLQSLRLSTLRFFLFDGCLLKTFTAKGSKSMSFMAQQFSLEQRQSMSHNDRVVDDWIPQIIVKSISKSSFCPAVVGSLHKLLTWHLKVFCCLLAA